MVARPGRFLLLILVLALVSAALERTLVAARARLAEPGGDARWIWAAGAHRTKNPIEPVAFFAVRDFEIEELTGHKAELAITADESYVVFVNAHRVGSGGYRGGAPTTLYDVTADLEVGGNRLVVELASSRGAGGLLAGLRLDGRPIAVTGGDWRIFRRWEPGLLRGWALTGGEAPQVWQRQPTGHWRPAPPVSRAVDPVELSGPVSRTARRVRARWESSSWRELDKSGKDVLERVGSWLLFDWGEEVTGYLSLELSGTSGEAGLLHVGAEAPDHEGPADAVILPVPGSPFWTDAFPRTFRYAFIGGLELRGSPVVRLVDGEPEPAAASNVFGIRAPRREPPVEEEVRRRLRTGTR